MEDTAAVLIASNFKLFFNIAANETYSQWLHSLVPFSEPDDQKGTFETMFDGAGPAPSCRHHAAAASEAERCASS